MEENVPNLNNNNEPQTAINPVNNGLNSKNIQQIAGAIVLAGIIIAGAILLKGNAGAPTAVTTTQPGTTTTPVAATASNVSPVGPNDRVIGPANAKVTLIMYEDFQCPFCGMFVKNSESLIRNSYVKNGTVQLVYRDYAFLGAGAKANGSDPVDESLEAAEAARCAGDQGQFWQYQE